MTYSRNQYFDFLRGIAIMMVIAIHTVPARECNFDTFTGVFYVVIRQLFNCAVPIFLAISGYFIGRKRLRDKCEYLQFLKCQIPKVYIPCLIFSTGWFLIELFKVDNNPILSLINLIFCGYSIYYFIALIIQLYLLIPILKKINNRGGVAAAAVLSFITINVITYMMQVEGRIFPLLLYAGPFVLWIVFFMLGIYFSSHSREYSLFPAVVMILIGLISSVYEAYLYLQLHNGGLGIKFSAFIYSIGIILLIFSSKIEKQYQNNRITRAIVFVGETSFGIYLLHMYVRIVVGYLIPLNNWMIPWILTLVITLCIIVLTKHILPSNFVNKYLGFR